MTNFFDAVDRVKPAYDIVYKITLFICKMLLITDILIATMSVAGRYISFIPDPSWSEEVILTLMAYMAVLSASLAIRNKSHIRMTALDKYLPKKVVLFLDILGDVAVLTLGIVMIVVGWRYASLIGSKGAYVSMPNLSRFWMYFPIPLAGVAMVVFQIEILIDHLRIIFLKEVE